MERTTKSNLQLESLASHFALQRESILHSWRSSVDRDEELTSPTSLPRMQFNDHIPELLTAFEKRLHLWPQEESAGSEQQRKKDAANHGLQRWQQGYQLREVTREWRHLHLCLVDVLESYSIAHPELEPQVMPTAWRALATLCSQGVSESTSQYFELEKVEAAGHVRDLEQTLAAVHELERQRADLFRQAAHDLRGNVGVVTNVTAGLTLAPIPDEMRQEFLALLQRSVSSLSSMLDEVMDLARLQAGYEVRNVETLDATTVLRELLQYLQPMAAERGLFLKAEGPPMLTVEGDAVKIRRVCQNLLLNALKYTSRGGVTLGWGDSRSNDPRRWMITVHDTGPGIHAGPGSPLVEAMEDATAEVEHVEELATETKYGSVHNVQKASGGRVPDPRSVHQSQGEGIGLSIVKRLCEILDASIEVASTPGEGTTFRVILPRRYDGAEQKP